MPESSEHTEGFFTTAGKLIERDYSGRRIMVSRVAPATASRLKGQSKNSPVAQASNWSATCDDHG